MTSIALRRERSTVVSLTHSFHLLDGVTALIFAAIIALIIAFPLTVSHDAALFLDTGNLILNGKQPYADFDEINFPLVMYVHAVPDAIARVLGVNPIPVFSVMVLVLAIGSVWGIRCILERRFEGAAPVSWRMIPVFIAFYTLFLFLTERYGQREHLFILLFLPFFFLRWERWQGGNVNLRWTVLVGVMGAVGAALKPHFLPIALAPEAYWIASALLTRHWKQIRNALFAPEMLGFVGTGLVYAAVLLIVPVFRQAIFDSILPYVTSSYADYGIGVTPLTLLTRLDTMLMWLALLVTLPAFIRNRPLVRPLWLLTFAAILVFCWQGKGWYYHRIPAIFGIGMLLAVVLFERSERRLLEPIFKVLLVILGYFVITLGGVIQMSDHYPAIRSAILTHSRPNDPVMFISSSVDPAYPLLVQTGRRSADRNLTGFPIGVDSADDHDLANYLASLSQSIASKHPPIILIDANATCYGCSAGYDMQQYLQQTGFIDQNIAPGYVDAGRVDHFELYLPK